MEAKGGNVSNAIDPSGDTTQKCKSERKIVLFIEGLVMNAELNDTLTARKILEILPLEGTVQVWGEEIYFDIPLKMDLQPDAREDIEIGTLAYWPMGPAFCIFFGPTPISIDEKPRAYSPVNILGHILGDFSKLKRVSSGARIRVTLG
jgi:hypothetical protein